MIFIYALIDPDTAKIRYIGKSIRPKQRLQNHMNEASNCHRSHWLQSLKKAGKTPHQVILQELDDDVHWQSYEIAWIKHGREMGWPLTNNTDGGDGVCNLPEETRKRMSKIWSGRKHKPETIEKLKAARALRVTSEETRKKHSNAMKGRKITWKEKIAEANRKIDDEKLNVIMSRLKNGEKVIDLSKKYGVHRTTITKIKHGRYK